MEKKQRAMTSMFCFVTYYTVVNKVSTESWTKESVRPGTLSLTLIWN